MRSAAAPHSLILASDASTGAAAHSFSEASAAAAAGASGRAPCRGTGAAAARPRGRRRRRPARGSAGPPPRSPPPRCCTCCRPRTCTRAVASRAGPGASERACLLLLDAARHAARHLIDNTCAELQYRHLCTGRRRPCLAVKRASRAPEATPSRTPSRGLTPRQPPWRRRRRAGAPAWAPATAPYPCGTTKRHGSVACRVRIFSWVNCFSCPYLFLVLRRRQRRHRVPATRCRAAAKTPEQQKGSRPSAAVRRKYAINASPARPPSPRPR